MMGNKQEILKELEELKRKVEGLEDEDEELWYLTSVGDDLAFDQIQNMFMVENELTVPGARKYEQPHGLGVYKSKEYAEMARYCLIGLLDELKKGEQDNWSMHQIITEWLQDRGKEVLEQGGCDVKRNS